MARQRIHNRRAARGSVGGGASWISYSDMMAALLLIFVLILTYSLSHYFSMLEAKEKELEIKDLQLRQSLHELGHTTQELELKTREYNQAIIILGEKDQELTQKDQQLQEKDLVLTNLQLALSQKETELDQLSIDLQIYRARLEEQQQAMQDQAAQIDALIGIRRTMISELSASFAREGIKATVDENGNIVLDSSIFFDSGRSTILPEGQAFLNRFIPVYLDVLLQSKYEKYLGEIIIEGHTDSTGDYQDNLKLSQQRALEVALFCLNMNGLTSAQKNTLENILTAKGRSESDLIYDAYGFEDKTASRRVEFKFSLKDAQMIEQMSEILKQYDLGE